ncbi:alpha/beta hydrolase [Streptomyces sp. SID11385]|uniref:dienelactone hydrolase family protein n=1 Tax=Streptomyces sp. SID11385 TaxID=2706031 RepID=UPI0013CD8E3E|nr:alpha/beta hydrolase [Streptomyces sp. SID11385]NEA39521.1 alpha/beta hydrolase [Streptomyces sp. SID11385]
MRFISSTHAHKGVREQFFSVGEVPGVLWSPEDAEGPRPLVVLGHGGGEHKNAPRIRELALRLVHASGFAAVCVDVPGHGDRPVDPAYDDLARTNQRRVAEGAELAPLIADFQAMVARQTVPEWRAALDAVRELPYVGERAVGYWGVSLGCGLGVPFVAAEHRVRAAVLGLGGGDPAGAVGISVPVRFLVRWDDERVPRADSLALFDALGSADKTLHAGPGTHSAPPEAHELDDDVRFLIRHLSAAA